jgi:peptidoglycan hydrolase CwlO-like protein
MNETIFTVMVSAITGIVTFFLGVAKSKKEVEGMTLTNLEKSTDIYARVIADLKLEIEDLKSEIAELKAKVDDLTKENHELKQMLKKK